MNSDNGQNQSKIFRVIKQKARFYSKIYGFNKRNSMLEVFKSTYKFPKLNVFFLPLETVSKPKSILSSSIAGIDFQEPRNSFPMSTSASKII